MAQTSTDTTNTNNHTNNHTNNKAAYSTPSARWRAIVNRDAAATCFVYGVRTTKIYCRPRCPARLARRANVEFYDTPPQAEKAGYRPCKRCKPEDLRVPPDPHVRLARQACETMMLAALAGGEKPRPTLQDLSSEAGLTPSHFHRVFKKVVGITPGKYARDLMEGKTVHRNMLPGPGGRPWPPKEGETPQQHLPSSGLDAAMNPPAVPVQGLGLSSQPPGHEPNTAGINWNEFDLMLAATTGGTRVQMDYLTGNHTHSGGSNGAFCFSGATDHNNLAGDPSQVVVDGSLLSLNSQTEHQLGFPDFLHHNDTAVDFAAFDSSAFDSPGLTTRPTSVPSSQQSLSPSGSPQLFDSLPDSPLLFEEVDWLERSGLYPGYA